MRSRLWRFLGLCGGWFPAAGCLWMGVSVASSCEGEVACGCVGCLRKLLETAQLLTESGSLEGEGTHSADLAHVIGFPDQPGPRQTGHGPT